MKKRSARSGNRISADDSSAAIVPIDLQNLMPLKEFARKLGMTLPAVRTKKSRGILPSWIFVKIGGSLFVDSGRFNEWINEQEQHCEIKRRRAVQRMKKLVG